DMNVLITDTARYESPRGGRSGFRSLAIRSLGGSSLLARNDCNRGGDDNDRYCCEKHQTSATLGSILL
ncbi:MAG TPA: hypothetical protein VGW32_05745, partial [Pyrinomonadaceae bacterium]|nr:hypothetical protein [Pyrinomonadaceae bacterium]